MFDVAIIGSGPAGISAALTLQARGKNFVWFGNKQFSPKVRAAEKIRNYPGLSNVSGEELEKAFRQQIDDMEISITEKTVTGVYRVRDHYSILCDQEITNAYAVILTTGVTSVKPILGEREYVGRGVSYCATCDGFLYKGKTIGIVCTSKDLEHEISFLSELADKVYLIPMYKDVAVSGENIEIIQEMPKEISGKKKAERLCFADREIAVDGVFMLKDAVSPGVLVKGIAEEEGHIVVDRRCATNLPGCYAAGDCTGRPYQYAKATGEGNVAAHSALDYLAQNGYKTAKASDKPQTLEELIDAVDRSRLPDDAHIEKIMLRRLTEGAFDLIPLSEGDEAVNGDVVTFSVLGGEGRYGKENLRLTLGQGIYDSTVENAMIGKTAGDVLKVAVGEQNLTITIHEICRKHIPVMTDDMVKAQHMENVTNLEQFREALKEEMTMNEIYTIAGEIIQALMENAPEPEYDEETLAILGQLEIGFFDKHFKENKGKSLDEMTPAEMKEELGCSTKEEFINGRHEWYKIKLKQCCTLSQALHVELKDQYDFRVNYEALGLLQMKAVEVIKTGLTGGGNHGS